MKDLEYDEFEVLLERSGDAYSARVVDSPTGPAPAMPFVPPPETAELPALRLGMRGPADSGVADTALSSVDPKAFGTALFRALFNDKALNILRTSQYVAAKEGHGLRLRITFADVAELANLPWELLYDPGKHKFLCQYRATPTIRLLDLPEPVPPLQVIGPLRMLVVISGPQDLPELDVEKEWVQLQEELEPLVEAGRIELVRLAAPTLEALHAKVLAQEFHVFHFIGHGGIDANGEGHLAFTRPNGLQHKVLGSHLGVMLSNSPIRLAVLNSCQGGTVSAEDPYGSSAIALVEQGIPAVIAMQFPISDEAARTFSRTLYDSVAAGRSVDLGVTLGRQAVLATSETEWATPVLYLRGRDGVLFELEDGPVDTILEDPKEVLDKQAPAPVTQPVPATAPTDEPVVPPAASAPSGVPTLPPEPVSEPAPQPTPPPPPSPVHPFVATPPDEPIEVNVRHVRRLPIAILLVLTLLAAGWLLTRPREAALAAPTHVAASIDDAGLVSMTWDLAPVEGPHVARWEVYLDDTLVASATTPTASFTSTLSGQLSYRVIAIASDGTTSEPGHANPVTAPPITTSGKSTTTSSRPPTTKRPPTPVPAPTTADLRITGAWSRPAEGDAETVTFKTENYGKADVIRERVFVEALGGGQIYMAEFRVAGEGPPQICTVQVATATCDIGRHGGGVILVDVTVGWGATSTGLRATAEDIGGTTDPKKENNSRTFERGGPTWSEPDPPTTTPSQAS